MTARDVIDQALALSDAATDGPWERKGLTDVRAPHLAADLDDLIADFIDSWDAHFTAAARTLLPAFAKALQAVMAVCEESEASEGPYRGIIHTTQIHNAITTALEGVPSEPARQ